MYYQIHYEKKANKGVYYLCKVSVRLFFIEKGSSLMQYIRSQFSLSPLPSASHCLPSFPYLFFLCFLFRKKSRHPKDTNQTGLNKIQQEKTKALIPRLHKATQQEEKKFKSKQKSETHPASLSGG